MRPVSEMLSSDLKAAFRQAMREELVCRVAGKDLSPMDAARLEEMRAEMKKRGLVLEEHMPRERRPGRGR